MDKLSIESLDISLDHFRMINRDKVLLELGDVSYENFFRKLGKFIPSVVKYGFFYGKLDKVELRKLPGIVDIYSTDYGQLRGRMINVAPGFNGNLLDYLTLLEGYMGVLSNLVNEIEIFNRVFTSILNGRDLLESPLNIGTLKDIGKVKLDGSRLDSFYKRDVITKIEFGKVYRNISEVEKSIGVYNRLVDFNNRMDYRRLGELLEDLSEYVSEFKYGGRIDSDNLSNLMEVVRNLANNSDVSVKVQMGLKEWSESFKGMFD